MIWISQAPSGWSTEAARGTRNALFVVVVSSPSAPSRSSQTRASTTACPVTRDDSPRAAPTANRCDENCQERFFIGIDGFMKNLYKVLHTIKKWLF